jgi:dTDP-4-amino-4,6-dideoxygalactose transaminase
LKKINVTKTYLPPFEEYAAILKRAWDKGWITNHGELVQELEANLKAYLGTEHLLFCSNGTIVLQMAIKALGLTKEIITTPFSYVATANAIAWAGCTPVFTDIEPITFTIDPEKIEAAITENTEAILATHVYGFPCKIEAIETLAHKHNLKVIYDGAHAFGASYKKKSLLSYGDISTCSFHATKLFHTVEGGLVICHNEELYRQLSLYRSFGHIGDDYYSIGINGKNSELHAAMGLCLLPKVPGFIAERKGLFQEYCATIGSIVTILNNPETMEGFQWNYAYLPVILKDSHQRDILIAALAAKNIYARKYFAPSLNMLDFYPVKYDCPVSEDIANRILCLPFYVGMTSYECESITSTIKMVIAA